VQNKRKASSILKKIKKERGRSLIHEKLFSLFPDYLELSNKSFQLLMIKEGYLPIPWRFYLAIMAASSIKCEYMLRCLEDLFLYYGGDESWLIHGLKSVPEKLKKLAKYNEIMAHQPWKITADDISELFSNKNTYLKWNNNELVHASTILFNFHKLSSFVKGLNLNIPQTLCEENEDLFLNKLKKEITNDDECFQRHVLTNTNLPVETADEDTSKAPLSYLDFNWFDNAYDILSELYPHIKDINSEINYILNFSAFDKTRESSLDNIDIRRCINCYTEKIFGYEHDDFEYTKIIRLLSRDERDFIKNVVSQPHLITKDNIEEMGIQFSPEEVIFIVLTALNLKNRLQLTYLSNCIYELRKRIDE